MVCLDVRRCGGGGGHFQAGHGRTWRKCVTGREGVGVPGCEGSFTRKTHFQAGQQGRTLRVRRVSIWLPLASVTHATSKVRVLPPRELIRSFVSCAYG